jgi:hypothetical protein
VLHGLTDDRDARGAQQLAQLGEILALGESGDEVGALLGARLRAVRRERSDCGPSVPAAFHEAPHESRAL